MLDFEESAPDEPDQDQKTGGKSGEIPKTPIVLLFYDCFGQLEASIVPLLSGSLVFLRVSRDQVGYQIVDSIRDAVRGHGCMAAPTSRRMRALALILTIDIASIVSYRLAMLNGERTSRWLRAE